MQSRNSLSNTLLSFVSLGIFIVLAICALIFFSYVFLIGAIIGALLFLYSYIRSKLHPQSPHQMHHKRQDGRVIEQNDE